MSAATIDLTEFRDALSRYPALIKSMTKPPKDGVLTLTELDKFRYIDAPSRFSKKAGGKAMALSDIQKLVDWKLRHGTFRPTLPKLVAKNSDEIVTSATSDAFKHYQSSPADIAGTLQKLSNPLKGVGPATASLILSIHDPENIIFFSDEAYRWLCAGGEKASPKYTAKEFTELHVASKQLIEKLKVSPIEVEKVSFVLIKENEPVHVPKAKPVPSGRPRGRPTKPESEKKPKKPTVPGRGRGRPPGSKKVVAETTNGTGKKRGRPAAVKAEETQTPSKSGSKRKADDGSEATPDTGRSKRSKA